MKNSKFLAAVLITVITFSGCSSDDAKIVNEEEVITTVTTTLTSGNQSVVLKSKYIDGDTSKALVTVSGELKVNTTYNGVTTFMNETKTPAEDITPEIKKEGDAHQLFYQAPAAIGVFTYGDTDKNGKPIGLVFTLKTGATATSGVITVTLRHEPNKSATGVATGDITNAGGATDATVRFTVQVVN